MDFILNDNINQQFQGSPSDNFYHQVDLCSNLINIRIKATGSDTVSAGQPPNLKPNRWDTGGAPSLRQDHS